MCRAKDCQGGRRCPSSKGEARRAYQRARYAAQKAQRSVSDTQETKVIPADQPIPDLSEKSVPTMPEIKARAEELRAEMDECFSMSQGDQTDYAFRKGFTRLTDYYDHLEERSTAVGRDLMHVIDNDASVTIPDEDFSYIEYRKQLREELKNEYPLSWAYHESMSLRDIFSQHDRFAEFAREQGYGDEPENVTAFVTAAKADYDKNKRKLVNRINAITRAYPPESVERARKLEEASLKRLKEIRDMGGEVEAVYSSQKHKEALTHAAAVFPSAWVQKSNEASPMIVKVTTSRAHYSPISDQYKRETPYFFDNFVHVSPDGEIQSKNIGGVDTDKRVFFHMYDSMLRDKPLKGQTYLSAVAITSDNAQDDPPTQSKHGYTEGSYAMASPDTQWEWRKYSVVDDSGKLTQEKEGWVSVVRAKRAKKSKVITGYSPEITLNREERNDTGIGEYDAVGRHELSHRMEDAVPGITELEHRFRARRETLPDGSLEEMTMVNTGLSEKGRKDNYFIPYVGKEYRTQTNMQGRSYSFTEVLSVGMESMFGRKFGSLVGNTGDYKGDPDHRAFVLGLLATR